LKRISLVLLAAVASLAIAAESTRIITVKADKSTGNPRTGPFELTGNVRGTVQNLVIVAPQGSLSAPEGTPMPEAAGKRVAAFQGGVKVTRGRLTATGPSLNYSESTGQGVLSGPTKILQKAAKEGDDDVNIEAGKATFDVDNDISTSSGDVRIVSGKQSGNADTVVFDEKKELAKMNDAQSVKLTREPRKQGENRLDITAKEARMLTGEKLLVATGGITLISGDNTTTGDSLYYDDEAGIATVIGRPAKNVSKKTGTTQGTTLINNTRSGKVTVGKAFTIPLAKFKLEGEK
jgi:lipopolysaccharide transport protein LptA